MSVSQTSSRAALSSDPPRLLGSLSRWLTFGIILIACIAFFATASEDWLTIVNYTLIFAIAALGLNVLSGYTGQVSLGIAFFMAIGAYTSAWLGGTPPTSTHDPLGLGLPVVIWLPAAGIVAALVGALLEGILSWYRVAGPGLHRALYLLECQCYKWWPTGAHISCTDFWQSLVR